MGYTDIASILIKSSLINPILPILPAHLIALPYPVLPYPALPFPDPELRQSRACSTGRLSLTHGFSAY